MKTVSQGIDIMIPPNPGSEEVYRHIERIGRVCYKSEDNITADSYKGFIERLRTNEHWAMLEHYIFIIELSEKLYNDLMNEMIMFMQNDPWFSNYIGFIKFSKLDELDTANGCKKYIMSFNITAINNLWKSESISKNSKSAFLYVLDWINDQYECLVNIPADAKKYDGSGYVRYTTVELPFGIAWISMPELAAILKSPRSYDVYALHASMTVKFHTTRAICMEVLRHRPASYAMESTRYANYSKGKFGSEITVVKPVFAYTNAEMENKWNLACQETEIAYMDMMRDGAKAQDAREVLPNALKAELVMTARIMEFQHFFKFRAHSAAHPMMQELAYALMDGLIKVESALLGEEEAKKMITKEVRK